MKTNRYLFAQAAARAAAAETRLVAGLDSEGLALRAASNAATEAHHAANKVFRADRSESNRALCNLLARADYAARSAWGDYLLRTQATRARRAIAALGLAS